jgi:hypothetical protein
MAFENLFIRTKKSIGAIELDAVLTETHSNQVRLTKNPVELGADITDHAVIEPKRLNIVAQVSDTPLGTAAFGQIVDLVTGLFGTSTSQNITRSNAAYNAMVQLMDQREPIQVQTKLRLYENMVITNLSTPQDKDSSRIALMTITLEEVLITQSQIVSLEPAQLKEGSPREQGSSADKRGRQEPVTPNETTNKSVLKSVTDWIGG